MKSEVCTQIQMETLALPEQMRQDVTGHNFILCIKVRWSCEKALVTPRSMVSLLSISTASEGFPYLTLLHYYM